MVRRRYIKISFVEREHTNDDTFGNNLVPENLETGEYVYNTGVVNLISNRLYDFTIGIIIAVSERLDGTPTSSFLDYSFNALAYRYFKADAWQQASNFVDEYSKSGKGDAIVSIYMFPLDLIGVTSESPSSGWVNIAGVRDIMSRKLENVFTPLDGYTPKNNKMYAYPYRTLNVCSPGSSEKEYRYEYFDTNFLENNGPFNLFSALGGSVPVVAIPRAYKGLNVNYDETITTSAYPTCSWINDTFKNWYAQNQMGLNMGVISSTIGGALGAIGGVVSGNYLGAVSSTVAAIEKFLIQWFRLSNTRLSLIVQEVTREMQVHFIITDTLILCIFQSAFDMSLQNALTIILQCTGIRRFNQKCPTCMVAVHGIS